MEDRTNFSIRMFCDRECRLEYDLARERSDRAIYNQTRKHLKPKCEICNSKYRLQIHHVDHNRQNNKPKNLQTLCMSCHLEAHGKGRIQIHCTIHGCLNGHHAKGYCMKHYTRWIRHGDPNILRGLTEEPV